MSDRPILFQPPMARALLDGRKTQTRRVLKPQPFIDEMGNFCEPDGKGKLWNWGQHSDGRPCTRNYIQSKIRIGIGDRLWVREAWRASKDYDAYPPRELSRWPVHYEANGSPDPRDEIHMNGRLRPSMFMPRWASRLTLVVTDVRVQRLQDISHADALAEGVEMESADPPFYYVPGIWPHSITAVGVEYGKDHAQRSYGKLWDHINGPGAWEANPWVAAYTFTVHRVNIDQMAEAA